MEGKREVFPSHVIELPLLSLAGELIHHISCVHALYRIKGPGFEGSRADLRGARDSRGLHCLLSCCGWICINQIREVT